MSKNLDRNKYKNCFVYMFFQNDLFLLWFDI